MTSRDENLWQFSLRVYGEPRVKEALLRLQDECGADVNLLLYCCYLAATGRGPLDTTAIEAAETAIGTWRESVTVPLRAIRRRLEAPGPLAELEGARETREQVLAAEITSERVTQHLLERLATGPAPQRHGAGALAEALVSLGCYLCELGERKPRHRLEQLLPLLVACFDVNAAEMRRLIRSGPGCDGSSPAGDAPP